MFRVRLVEHEVKIETVPQRVARAALQLDEMGVNRSSFHAQTGQFRLDERGLGLVQIPLAHIIKTASCTSHQSLDIASVASDAKTTLLMRSGVNLRGLSRHG